MKKILVQSSTNVKKNPVYLEGIQNHAKKVLSPNFTTEIDGVETPYSSEVHFMSYEFLNNRDILKNIVEAEKSGYDAVAFHCFLDPILDEARELVDIPVIGMGETSMLTSLMYGKKFAIVTYTPQLAKKSYGNLIQKYGLSDQAVETQFFEVSIEDLGNAFHDPKPILDKFISACEKAIAQGAEVILPGCGLLNILCLQNNITQETLGATVMDVTGMTLKMAETQVILKEVSGTSLSRAGYYESPKNLPEF
ncbi:aspartate/glutamate racemase family protein [Sporosarcina sp. ACRSM]|uniref:aspartate/glutamate racemase family protein n=1 Tax=Sporosarcina sp. ACRSM TaxID=2918216 RepID=UPI001EF602AE|nr:aspartate/glutamate racemase family protein [Sporosarcina sp. ACRSM]MCG7336191.1 aspartate/glutamate racemase family protein [Sporosarcina sp. ACRSM]